MFIKQMMNVTNYQLKGVTLMELMVTIIIIGILAAIAIPMFPRAMEGTKAKEAVAALQQIRTGERMYRVAENDYWPSPGGGPQQEIKDINDTLGTFLDYRDNRNWDYSVTITTNPDTFTATAEREGGMYDTGKITIDENGDINAVNPWPSSLLPGQ